MHFSISPKGEVIGAQLRCYWTCSPHDDNAPDEAVKLGRMMGAAGEGQSRTENYAFFSALRTRAPYQPRPLYS